MRRQRVLDATLALLLNLGTAHYAVAAETDPAVLRWLPHDYPRDRARVDPRALPWRAIGRVNRHGSHQHCTGALVGERWVLTAAHFVWPLRQFPDEVHFLAGFAGDRYQAHSRVVRFRWAALTDEAPRGADDWALLELREPLGRAVGVLPWALLDTEGYTRLRADERAFTLVGYRGDRPFVQTAARGCRLGEYAADGRLMTHDCPTAPGDSGGPLLLERAGTYLLIGIGIGGLTAGQATAGARWPRIVQGVFIPSACFAATLTALGPAPRPLFTDDARGATATAVAARTLSTAPTRPARPAPVARRPSPDSRHR